MNTKQFGYFNKVKRILVTVGILLVIYVSISYFFIFFLPFILAILLSSINEPIINYLQKKLSLSRKTSSIISLLTTVSIAVSVIILIFLKVYSELTKLQSNLPQYIETLSGLYESYYNRATILYYNLPENITTALGLNFQLILSKIEGIISIIASSILGSLTSIPKIVVFITVTLMSSYFISSDKITITNFLYRQFPFSYKKNISGVKSDTISAIFGYFKAQLVIISITFLESTLGFIIIGADYAVLMGFVTALCDVVPVLGTNMIFIPWILWNLLNKNFIMALGLAWIYVLGIILRQILEPRIVAHQTGLHPFVSLVSMYGGFLIFGFPGLFIGPILVIFLKSLQNTGIINIWND